MDCDDDRESRVYQPGFLDGQKIWWGADRAEWEAMMKVQQRTSYTLGRALYLNFTIYHFGPWKPAFRKLCRTR